MPNKGIGEIYKRIGAPLSNVRTSWGASLHGDKSVILTIWQDNLGPIKAMVPDSTFYPPNRMVCYIGCHDRDFGGGNRHGWKERQKHIEQLQAGAQGWGIMATSKLKNGEIIDQKGARRDIDGYDQKRIWKFGEVFQAMDPHGGGEDFWVTLEDRLKFNDFLDSLEKSEVIKRP